MELRPDMMEHLNRIDWFSTCGTPLEQEGAMLAKSPAQVKKSIRSIKWENLILDRRGDFTEKLYLDFPAENRAWNELVRAFKAEHMPALQKKWQAALEPLGLWEKAVWDDVSFNVLNIAVIDAYRALLPMPELFQRLLGLYESGRLPCGWSGAGETGNLVVY